MWSRRKAKVEELDKKLALLAVQLEAVKAATAKLNQAAVVATTTDKVLKQTIRRAENVNTMLKRTAQGR